MQNRIDEMVVRFAEQVLRFRWLVMALAVILAVAAASGARFLAFDTNYRVFFGKDNPQLLAFDAVESIYSKNDNVMFVLKPTSGDAFSPAMLRAMAKLTEGGW